MPSWYEQYTEMDFYTGEEWQPHVNSGCWSMERVGKKAAGRLLDSHTWDEFPEVVSTTATPPFSKSRPDHPPFSAIWQNGITPNIAPISIAIAALSVSLSAFVVAVLNYRRKTGHAVRGSFNMMSSVSSDDRFVSYVVLNNMKDRAITIFEIYLKVGSNCYIKIEDFASEPLILGAYTTYQKKYGPIEFYSMNMKRVSLREALSDQPKVKKRLVLSTSEGKYVVSTNIRMWSPTYLYFCNHLTLDLHIVRSIYKDVAIGGNIKFVIEFLSEGGREEIVPIHAGDWALALFKTFQLTEEALATKETLESFLQNQIESGKLMCKSFTVLDPQEWRARNRSHYSDKVINAKLYNAFQYYILGRLATIYSNWRRRPAKSKAPPNASE
jgi:hypothetical protein